MPVFGQRQLSGETKLRFSLEELNNLGSVLMIATIGQLFCTTACLTSASRMTYAFARDGGLPFSDALRRVNPASKSPSVAVWFAAITAGLFTILVPYVTIAAVCVTKAGSLVLPRFGTGAR